jgi:hypothetical protein
MTAFPGAEQPRGPEDYAPIPPELSLFARIEDLIGEERRLLATAAEDRTPQEHERLRAIGEELDRTWDHLRERAQRLGRRAGDERT